MGGSRKPCRNELSTFVGMVAKHMNWDLKEIVSELCDNN